MSQYYIRVNKAQTDRQRVITSKSDFFKGRTIFKVEKDKIIFKKPTIDYRGKSYKFCLHVDGFYHSTILCEIPLGKFYFDEDESNEDIIVAYFEPDNN